MNELRSLVVLLPGRIVGGVFANAYMPKALCKGYIFLEKDIDNLRAGYSGYIAPLWDGGNKINSDQSITENPTRSKSLPLSINVSSLTFCRLPSP